MDCDDVILALAAREGRGLGAAEAAALGEARFSLAKALAADPQQRTRARELATTALGELDKDDAAEVRTWLRAH